MIQDRVSPFKSLLKEHTELRAQVNTNRAVTMLNGNIVSNLRSEESGVSARMYKGRYGLLLVQNSGENIRKVILAAEENANFMDSKSENKPMLPTVGTGKKNF